MRKELNNDDSRMQFVLKHYKTGHFDPEAAMRKLLPKRTVPLWRKWTAAASVALVLFVGAYASWRTFGNRTDAPERVISSGEVQQAEANKIKHFHFENAPLPEVLSELTRYYGVNLTASDTDKRLTADFDSASLDETLRMIEQVLDVRITKH